MPISLNIVKRPACLGDLHAMQCCDGAYPELSNWRARDYKHCIRDPDMDCVIVEAGGLFAGYMISERYVDTVEVWRVVVDRMLLRCGIGSHLVGGLTERVIVPRRGVSGIRVVLADVKEENLRAQQFFRSLGFRVKLPLVLGDGEVFYRFVYDLLGDRKC